ncbi:MULTISPECIES: VOC family protein [Bacteroidaceae]|jgi:hypothetical protein|uniref:Lactoylglutathione lyase n=1 Tax=Bacteroides clarus TaxID=626929 RepID=A0A1Y4JQA1_9BACE|nr:hypothetical protein [Bacteroides clarus]OUP33926.1 hypothetical protein B5F24_09120 [Bacteroides clarus]
MRKINHIGIPVQKPVSGEVYNAGMQVYLTDFTKSPNKIEFLRFDKDSWMPEKIQTLAHIAYEVDNLDGELENAKVLLPKTIVNEHLTIAFIEEEGIALELMQFN